MRQDTWLEISASALAHNVSLLRRAIGPHTALGCCVKANAYGHGLKPVASALTAAGVGWMMVYSLDEARLVRRTNASVRVLLLGILSSAEWQPAIKAGFDLLLTEPLLHWLERHHQRLTQPVRAHIKVDTGLSRLGWRLEELPSLIERLQALSHPVELVGLATHLAEADDPDHEEYWAEQLDHFDRAAALFSQHGLKPQYRHASKGSAALMIDRGRYELVRAGLITYGCPPSAAVAAWSERHGYDFRPALSWRTRIVQLRRLPAGQTVGYSRTYRTSRPTVAAILPIGYSDGLDRRLSNLGQVLVRGRLAPIIGRVYMNMTSIDVTDIPEAASQDAVTLIGQDGTSTLTAYQMAEQIGTTPYEVLARLPQHLPRRLVK